MSLFNVYLMCPKEKLQNKIISFLYYHMASCAIMTSFKYRPSILSRQNHLLYNPTSHISGQQVRTEQL